MNFIDKVGEGICASIDMIIDKNRQLAQMNRLSTIIRTETEIINNAYIALGKQYRQILEGGKADEDMSRVIEVLAYSEKRLKKAQARYDYIKVYGVPIPHAEAEAKVSTAAAESDTADEGEPAGAPAEPDAAADENPDITIACADDSADNTDTVCEECADTKDADAKKESEE